MGKVDYQGPSGRMSFYNNSGDPDYIYYMIRQDAALGNPLGDSHLSAPVCTIFAATQLFVFRVLLSLQTLLFFFFGAATSVPYVLFFPAQSVTTTLTTFTLACLSVT